MDMLEAWIHFLQNPDSDTVKELAKKHDEIRQARELLVELSQDTEVVKKYNERIESLNNQ